MITVRSVVMLAAALFIACAGPVRGRERAYGLARIPMIV